MAIVKNDLRSSMLNDRLNALCLMTIERTLLKNINFQDVVIDFANVKARKSFYLNEKVILCFLHSLLNTLF